MKGAKGQGNEAAADGQSIAAARVESQSAGTDEVSCTLVHHPFQAPTTRVVPSDIIKAEGAVGVGEVDEDSEREAPFDQRPELDVAEGEKAEGG